ncbi:unnamed protein product [Schistosoma turkestanicum]|nr:unnamed protein product [Schistosoma turkestanicum]
MLQFGSKSFDIFHEDQSDEYRLLSYLSLPNLNETYFLYNSECSHQMQSTDQIRIQTCSQMLVRKSEQPSVGKNKTRHLSKSFTLLSSNKLYSNGSSSLQNITSLYKHRNSRSVCLSLFTPFDLKSECAISLPEQKSQLSFDENQLLNKNKHMEEFEVSSPLCINCDSEIQKSSVYLENQRNVSDSQLLKTLHQTDSKTANSKYEHTMNNFNSHHSLEIEKKTKSSNVYGLHSSHFIPHILCSYFHEQHKKLEMHKKRRKTCFDQSNTNNVNTTTSNTDQNQSVKMHFLRHFSFINHDRKLSPHSNNSHLKTSLENNNNNNSENVCHTTELAALLDRTPRLERKLSRLAIGVRDKITTLYRSHSSVATNPYTTDFVVSNNRVFLEKLFRSGGPTREDVEDWARSFEAVLRNKYGVLVFREFLRTEFSDENIRFWLICEEYRNKSGTKNMQRKAFKIFNEYVAVQAVREVNLDSNTRLQTEKELESANKNTFDQCQRRIQSLMEKDSYRRFLRSDLYLTAVEMSKIRECNRSSNKVGRHSVIDFRAIKHAFTTTKHTSAPSTIISSTKTNTDGSSCSMTNLVSGNISTRMNEK